MSRFRYLFLYSGGLFLEMASIMIVLVVVGVILNFFVFSITPIKGVSMEPNFHSGDVVFVNKFVYLSGDPKRGDVVGLRFPGDPNKEKYIKRLIGLPGDTILINAGKVYVNAQPLKEGYLPKDMISEPDMSIKIKDDQYFIVGDNRPNSSDSRIWGTASKKDFIGKVKMVVWPLKDFHFLEQPQY